MKPLARVYSAELDGIEARPIEVEIDLNVGLHAFNIVGLADKALSEARERVSSAMKNSGFKPPNRENRKITVNLAPADVRKAGSQYDLAIAVGYLAATGQAAAFEAGDKMFLGELALDGRLRPVHGTLSVSQLARNSGFEFLVVPAENANEAAAIPSVRVIPAKTLADVMDFLENRDSRPQPHVFEEARNGEEIGTDFSEIEGQESAKRAMTIAAAGGHNLLLSGPPGVGKSLMAKAMPGILPEMDLEESIEVTKIWSAAGLAPSGLIRRRPFRAPHQTASLPAMIGGGQDPKPGEISLAHRGVLFLDELPEFPKQLLESLRAPMESGAVHVARAKTAAEFPARFTLVAAMNPCPCGFFGDPEIECKCSAYEIMKYSKKISGPLPDRIDLQVRVGRFDLKKLRGRGDKPTESLHVRAAVEKARAAQKKRLGRAGVNAEMTSKQTERLASLDSGAEKFLDTLKSSELSPRGYYRLIKTARTIADLDGNGNISAEDVAEAYAYRVREQAI